MTDKINELLRLVEEFKPKAAAEIEEFRIRILGKKGELNALMEEFKTVAPELKRELGQQLNRLKNEATARIGSLREELQNAVSDTAASSGDLTRPGSAQQLGSRHPISLVRNQIVEVFTRPATCRTRSSSRRIPTSCCGPTLRRSRSGPWSIRNRRFA